MLCQNRTLHINTFTTTSNWKRGQSKTNVIVTVNGVAMFDRYTLQPTKHSGVYVRQVRLNVKYLLKKNNVTMTKTSLRTDYFKLLASCRSQVVSRGWDTEKSAEKCLTKRSVMQGHILDWTIICVCEDTEKEVYLFKSTTLVSELSLADIK